LDVDPAVVDRDSLRGRILDHRGALALGLHVGLESTG
jgi:hypothetical protein